MPPASEASLMFSFEVAGSTTSNILEESPVSEYALITTIIITPGEPPRIPTSISLLLQPLAPHISAVVSGQTPRAVATPLPVVPQLASTPSLVPVPIQVLPDDDPLEEIF